MENPNELPFHIWEAFTRLKQALHGDQYNDILMIESFYEENVGGIEKLEDLKAEIASLESDVEDLDDDLESARRDKQEYKDALDSIHDKASLYRKRNKVDDIDDKGHLDALILLREIEDIAYDCW